MVITSVIAIMIVVPGNRGSCFERAGIVSSSPFFMQKRSELFALWAAYSFSVTGLTTNLKN